MPTIDFGRTADDYARHRAGFPDAFFDRLAAWSVGAPGQRVVDVGTGTGTVARGFARRGCRVVGIDPSGPMLREAQRLDVEAGVRVAHRSGRAEALPLPEASVDVVTAGQCWHWFDRPRAAAEARRALVAGGRLVIAYFDWLPLPDSMVAATEALILAHNPAWRPMSGLTGIHPWYLPDLPGAGFDDIETASFDVDVPYSHAAWRGRIRASAGVAASLPPDQVARFDVELAALLAERFPTDPLAVPHRVWWVVARAAG